MDLHILLPRIADSQFWPPARTAYSGPLDTSTVSAVSQCSSKQMKLVQKFVPLINSIIISDMRVSADKEKVMGWLALFRGYVGIILGHGCMGWPS